MRTGRLLAAAAVSWCGMVVHNVADLPGQTLLSPETAYPSLIALALVAAHLARPSRGTAGALLGWAWLHLVGGGVLSVLPLEILPYAPEQSVRHYTFHVLYLAAQVPLIMVATRAVRRRRHGADQQVGAGAEHPERRSTATGRGRGPAGADSPGRQSTGRAHSGREP